MTCCLMRPAVGLVPPEVLEPSFELPLLGAYGARLLLVIGVSTWIGLAVTALVLQWFQRGDDAELR